MKNLLLICSLLLSVSISAQTTYYKMHNGKVVNQVAFDSVKKSLSSKGIVEENFTKIVTKKDSIIKSVVFSIQVGRDPYSNYRKNVGKKFPIEDFKDASGMAFKPNYLEGKPTFVTFWFTRCPPCIEELPMLKSLKKKFGDKINFIAITFDPRNTVNSFAKKKKFDYEHITDADQQLKAMGIQSYPMNVMLDKSGKITRISGDIIKFEKQTLDYLTSLL